MKPKTKEFNIEVEGFRVRILRHPPRPRGFFIRKTRTYARGYFVRGKEDNPRFVGEINFVELDEAALAHELVHAAFEMAERKRREALRSDYASPVSPLQEEAVATCFGLLYEQVIKQPGIFG